MSEAQTVGTAQHRAADPAEQMLARGIASSENRPLWLAARALRVTATEAAKIAGGSAAARRELVQQKLHPELAPDLSRNQYVQRGNEREPAIAAWCAQRWPGMTHNQMLIAAEQNPLHAATPDVYGIAPDGSLVVGDLKTSKYDLDPRRPDGYFWTTHYMDQLQWQMYCCGATRALFVWEQHDNQWPNPEPLDLEPLHAWIVLEPARVERMVAQADLLLAELAAERAKAGLPEPDLSTEADQEADGLGLAILAARVEEATAKARREAVWTQLQTLLAARPSFSKTGLSRVTWSPPRTTTTSVPDEEAALTAPWTPPETGIMHDDVTGADLKADLERAQAVWAAHLGRFRKDVVSETKASLTVTDPAAKRATKGKGKADA